MEHINSQFGQRQINWNIFSIDKIVVTNHTLEIGVYSVAGANDWCNLDLAMLRKID